MHRSLAVALLAGTALFACQEPSDPIPAASYACLFDSSAAVEEVRAALAALPYEAIELEYFSTWTWGGDRITLRRGGGAHKIDRHGRWTGQLDPVTFGRLCGLIEQGAFEQLESRYASSGFDMGTRTVRVWPSHGGEPLEVEDYGSAGPMALWTIQSAIDGVARTIHWQEEAKSADAADRSSADR